MPEANSFDYRSQNPNVMHACGHDGHTTMLLGAARYLAETRNFDGTVHFIFQPAEENGGGGEVMVKEGLFDRFPCDMVFGAHNDTTHPDRADDRRARLPSAPTPTTSTSASRDAAATPPARTAAIDPVVVGAQIVLALQTLVARRVDPLDSAVVSTCQFHAGTATNVIPDEATLSGTVRTLKPETREEVQRLMGELVAGIAQANGAEAEFTVERGYPSVINDPEAVARAARRAPSCWARTR